jgi:hypothetical protein
MRFGRDERREQRAEDIRRQSRSRVTYGDLEIGAPDFAADHDVAPVPWSLCHRIHCIHDQIHEHLLQEHRITVDGAGLRTD